MAKHKHKNKGFFSDNIVFNFIKKLFFGDVYKKKPAKKVFSRRRVYKKRVAKPAEHKKKGFFSDNIVFNYFKKLFFGDVYKKKPAKKVFSRRRAYKKRVVKPAEHKKKFITFKKKKIITFKKKKHVTVKKRFIIFKKASKVWNYKHPSKIKTFSKGKIKRALVKKKEFASYSINIYHQNIAYKNSQVIIKIKAWTVKKPRKYTVQTAGSYKYKQTRRNKKIVIKMYNEALNIALLKAMKVLNTSEIRYEVIHWFFKNYRVYKRKTIY